MPTALTTKTRNAGLVALTLVLAATCAYPAQAGSILSQKPIGGTSSDKYDCDSRQDVAYAFQKYGLRHIDVSKTHDRYIYRVTGLLPAAPALHEDAFDSRSLKTYDYVRYVVIYDGCRHEILEQLQPRSKEMSLPM